MFLFSTITVKSDHLESFSICHKSTQELLSLNFQRCLVPLTLSLQSKMFNDFLDRAREFLTADNIKKIQGKLIKLMSHFQAQISIEQLKAAFRNDFVAQSTVVDLLYDYMENKYDPSYQNWRLLLR